ncbi:MAG TPA: hypothetical protein VFV38_09005 [Ktedonobacteraceae bacterium]|nr:hypothetical protein [Ktedonobacteraceae bacterium]
MSHIVQAKTTITNPNLALLGEALQIVAGAHEGGRVENYILDFGMRHRQVNTHLAVFTKQLTRGIGIELTPEGEMQFTGDPWMVDTDFALIQQEIVQTYVSLATMRALEQMGYTSEASQVEQQVVIRGVTYA